MDKWDRRKRVKNWAAYMHMFLLAEADDTITGEIMYVLKDDETEKETMYTYEQIKEMYKYKITDKYDF